MAIDAVIEQVRESGDSLRLQLAPRVDREGRDSIAGRRYLYILPPRTFEPQVGMEVWGAGIIEIVGGPRYDRRGTRLREKRRCPNCNGWMHWADDIQWRSGETRECFFCDTCHYEGEI